VSKPNKTSAVEFRVTTLKDLANVIIFHSDNHPLTTKKHSHYLLLKKIVLSMLNKEHDFLEGIEKIVKLRVSLNLGLSSDLNKAFSNTIPKK